MPRVKRICRVCGKEYEACYTRNTTGVFRWQDVACSRECGGEYLHRITAEDAADEATDEYGEKEVNPA